MHDHTFSKLAHHQIRHQATHKLECQPGDCMWSLYSLGIPVITENVTTATLPARIE